MPSYLVTLSASVGRARRCLMLVFLAFAQVCIPISFLCSRAFPSLRAGRCVAIRRRQKWEGGLTILWIRVSALTPGILGRISPSGRPRPHQVIAKRRAARCRFVMQSGFVTVAEATSMPRSKGPVREHSKTAGGDADPKGRSQPLDGTRAQSIGTITAN